ncbi:unnamed protein product [Linum trigynum]|uniref:Uncharacterized protein n=1 Tax=Linum trigynum TaxID=586398 RepID=A0AAV2DA11_9ROSI
MRKGRRRLAIDQFRMREEILSSVQDQLQHPTSTLDPCCSASRCDSSSETTAVGIEVTTGKLHPRHPEGTLHVTQ